jgi:hypothetical protein
MDIGAGARTGFARGSGLRTSANSGNPRSRDRRAERAAYGPHPGSDNIRKSRQVYDPGAPDAAASKADAAHTGTVIRSALLGGAANAGGRYNHAAANAGSFSDSDSREWPATPYTGLLVGGNSSAPDSSEHAAAPDGPRATDSGSRPDQSVPRQ